MASPPIVLRRLKPTDAQLLRKLNTLFGEAFADPETYGAEPPIDAYLEGLLAKEHVVVLVALAGEEVMGGLSPTNSTSSRGRGKVVHLWPPDPLAEAEAQAEPSEG